MSFSFARSILLLSAIGLIAFLVWPVAQIVQGGFVDPDGHFTLAYVRALGSNPLYREALANSFRVATATTVLAMAVAVPLAWLHSRFEFRGKTLLGAAVLLPMVLPPFVGAIGIKQIFGRAGALNALLVALHLRPAGWSFDWFAASPFWGVVLVEAIALYPVVYLNATAALSNVDPALEEAAQNLGATGWRRFRRVTLPLIQPGLFAGGTIVFIGSLTELGTPLIFDYARITSVQIFYGLREVGGNPFPYVLVTGLLVSSLAAYGVGKGVFGRDPRIAAAKATVGRTPHRLSGFAALGCAAVFVAVSLFAALPHLGVVLVACSRDWYGTVLPQAFTTENFRRALGHDQTVSAIGNSLRFASFSTLIDVVVGIGLAYVIVRSRSRLRHLVDFLAMLPLAVPGIVLAFGYLVMSQDGRAFAFLNPTRDPTILLVVAYSVRRLPYVVRSAAAGLQQTSVSFEDAAQNLGATPWRSLVRVTLPLIAANVIAGALLAFAFAMLEVSDSLVLAQKQAFYPITKAIMDLFQLLGDGKFIASALGVWAMAFLATTIAALSVLLGKRLGTLFRV